jgi:hypothetical protein
VSEPIVLRAIIIPTMHYLTFPKSERRGHKDIGPATPAIAATPKSDMS